MTNNSISARTTNVRLSALLVLAAALGGCASSPGLAQNSDRSAYREDSQTCERFGADRGRAFTQCMRDQQQRRDDAAVNQSEQIRNLAEAGRSNAAAARENLETVRRIRCNRAAERARERGEEPERCR
ncbi:hypothetical protein [Mesorhizobium denitrificans]|nr:hypothetical protein [Mesorhizobium denitrificans]